MIVDMIDNIVINMIDICIMVIDMLDDLRINISG